MSDDVVRLSMVGQIVRRRWRRLAICAAVGAVVGAGVSVIFSPDYEAASTVLLQGELGENAVRSEAEIVTSSVVLDGVADGLGRDPADLRESVSATVGDGNIVRIEAQADSARGAQELADSVARDYVAYSSQLVNRSAEGAGQAIRQLRDLLGEQSATVDRRIAGLGQSASPVRTELEDLRRTLADASKTLDDAQAAGRKDMVVLGPAPLPSGPGAPTLPHFVAGGALAFLLLGIFGHLVAARADRRLRTSSQIATVLGSPIVATIDVPDETRARATSTARRLLGGRRRRPRDTVGEETPGPPSYGRDVRYRRALARLRGTPDSDLRLLVVVPHDDAVAHRAAARLAVEAGVHGGPASVLTDHADIAALVRDLARQADPAGLRLTLRPASDPAPGNHRTVLHVVAVDVARPLVPDLTGVSGALILVSVGTRVPWELVDIGQACADAELLVLGALVLNPIPDEPGTAERSPDGPHAQLDSSGDESTDDKAMAGTT